MLWSSDFMMKIPILSWKSQFSYFPIFLFLFCDFPDFRHPIDDFWPFSRILFYHLCLYFITNHSNKVIWTSEMLPFCSNIEIYGEKIEKISKKIFTWTKFLANFFSAEKFPGQKCFGQFFPPKRNRLLKSWMGRPRIVLFGFQWLAKKKRRKKSQRAKYTKS